MKKLKFINDQLDEDVWNADGILGVWFQIGFNRRTGNYICTWVFGESGDDAVCKDKADSEKWCNEAHEEYVAIVRAELEEWENEEA